MPERVVNFTLLGLLVGAGLLAASMSETYYINLASRVAIIAMAASGLNLALGYGGMVSFGHAAFFGVGGYVAGISASHTFAGTQIFGFLPATSQMIPIWLAAMAVSALVALVIGAVSLRTRGVYFIMITLAFAQMIYYFAVSLPTYGGEDGLPIYLRNELPFVDSSDPLTFFLVCFAALSLILFWTGRIARSRFGAALTMARLNETRLATSGIEPFPTRLTAFVISAMITGWAGALYADLNGFVSPSMLSWHRSGELMVIVILGGTGRLYGPLAGAIAFVALEVVIGGITDRWQFFLGLILLGVVLFARGGLMGLLAGKARHE